MNTNPHNEFTKDDVALLAQTFGRPLPEGFEKGVWDKVHAREKSKEQSRTNETQRDKNRSRSRKREREIE